MEDELIQILGPFRYPIIRQGSLAPGDDYPDTFFTFWNNSDTEQSAYDNETLLAVESFDVNVYSNDPTTLYTLLKQAREAFKTAGWQTPDRGHDIASDEPTHRGRGFSVTYITTNTTTQEETANG